MEFYKAKFQSLRGKLCFWKRIMLFVIPILLLASTFFYSCCVLLLTMHPPGFCHLPSTWNVEGIFLNDKDKTQYLNNLTAQSLFITLHKNLNKGGLLARGMGIVFQALFEFNIFYLHCSCFFSSLFIVFFFFL